jgi:hypothetical protein
VRTAPRNRTGRIKAGRQLLTAADPLPDTREALIVLVQGSSAGIASHHRLERCYSSFRHASTAAV